MSFVSEGNPPPKNAPDGYSFFFPAITLDQDYYEQQSHFLRSDKYWNGSGWSLVSSSGFKLHPDCTFIRQLPEYLGDNIIIKNMYQLEFKFMAYGICENKMGNFGYFVEKIDADIYIDGLQRYSSPERFENTRFLIVPIDKSINFELTDLKM